jgi:RNA-directed DNA polymerase
LSKRKKPGAAALAANLERGILKLGRELLSGRYRPGGYVEIELFDPKNRIVSAAPFRDRVVHHALMAQVGPIFEAGFIAHSFAKRVGKVTHRAIKAYERYRDRRAFVLRCDVFRFLPAIDHAIFRRLLCRACPRSWPGIPGERSRAWQGHAPIRTQGHESYFSYSSN